MIKKSLWIAIPLLFMVSCPSPQERVVFEFSTNKSIPMIDVLINGKHGKLIIDTGSSVSFLNENFSKWYGFEDDIGDKVTKFSTIGGYSNMRKIENVKVEYEGKELVHDFNTSRMRSLYRATGAVGVIGADYLFKNQLIIDYECETIIKRE